MSSRHRQELLRFARSVAEAALGGRRSGQVHQDAPYYSAPVDRPTIVGEFGGVFVTFWSGQRQAAEPLCGRAAVLRGCVGTLAPTTHLVDSIEAVTRASLRDQRFAGNPISASELDALTIEVSILSDLAATDDPASLVPGTHGIVIRQGDRSGCFLPMVAAERGWSAEEFLSQCCTTKAGLPADAWRSPEAEVLLFTAEVFSEAATM